MNQKGQALIEAIILGFIIVLTLVFGLRIAILSYQSFALDEMIEITHICELQKKSNCKTQLSMQLSDLGFEVLNLELSKSLSKSNIKIRIRSRLGKIIEKESELHLDLKA